MNIKAISNSFKIISLTIVALVAAIGLSTAFAAAGVSKILSYQGRLTDTSGSPVANGSYCMRFSLYTAPSAGTKVWPSAAPSTMMVTVTNGVFNVGVGDTGAGGDSLANSNWNASYPNGFADIDTTYLNVDVNTIPSSCGGTWETLAPRQVMNATAYARVAESVYGGSVQVGTGAGVVSGQKLLGLDVKSAADTVGASGCSPNGALWYNSGNGRTMVCNSNLFQAVGSSIVNQFFAVTGPTTAVKTFTFPDASATVLTDNADVTVAQGGTGLSTLTLNNVILGNGASTPLFVAPGTSGNVLTSNGTTWTSAPASGGGGLTVGTTAISGGALGDVMYHATGNVLGEAVNVNIDGGNLNLTAVTQGTTPASPAAGTVTIFGRNAGGRLLAAIVGPSGQDTSLQPHLGRNKVAMWNAAGNSTTMTTFGSVALSASGTATTANVATTNMQTRIRRLEYLVTTAATTAVAGFRLTANQWFFGNTANSGGFHYIAQWGPATGVATATNRAFVGMSANTAAPTDVQPSSLVTMAGMGWDSADTNIQFMSNDASGTATKVDLGASFPVPTVDRTSMYELIMFAAPNSTTLNWQVTNLSNNAVQYGTVTATADLPAVNTLLSPRGYMSVGGTSSVIGLALAQLYIETDY